MTDETPSMLPLTHDPEPDRPRQVIDASELTWETPEDALVIGLLDLCGCGMADAIGQDMAAWLRHRRDVHAAYAEHSKTHSVGTPGWLTPDPTTLPVDPLADKPHEYADLIGHVLTRAGLAEHGGSVGGSWLTLLGEQWLDAIDAIPQEDA